MPVAKQKARFVPNVTSVTLARLPECRNKLWGLRAPLFLKMSKATVRKMKQNIIWAANYNVLAIPIAAGVFYPSFGMSLRPEIAALLMSVSSIVVATNAVLLKRIERSLS